MRIPIPIFVYGYSVIALTLATAMISFSIVCGYKQRGDEISWRFIKLASTAASLIGIIFLLLNFERMTRDQFLSEGRDYAMDEFWNLKIENSILLSKYCNSPITTEETEGMCSAARSVNGVLSFVYIQSGTPLYQIETIFSNQRAKKYIDEANSRIQSINYMKPKKEDLYRLFSQDTRIKFAMLSILLLILGLAGSAGEATYQWRRAVLLAQKAAIA